MKHKLLLLLAMTLGLASNVWALDKDANDVYQIGTAQDLLDFAELVNDGTTGANAVLTTDIDLSEVLVGDVKWTPIGNADHKYTGTFDGKGYTISGFSYSSSSNVAGAHGLFGRISNATVKNFSISGTLTLSNQDTDNTNYYNGTIGAAEGSSVTISGIRSELHIIVTNCKAHTGGILGSTVGDSNPVCVENCEYSGKIDHSGSGDCQAGILGYTYNGGVKNCIFSGIISGTSSKYGGILGYCKIKGFIGVQNCLSIGKIVANEGNTNAAAIIANYNGSATSNVKNNYYKFKEGSTTSIAIGNKASSCGTPVLVDADQLASGEVCYKLNESKNGGTAWRQNLSSSVDATPVPYSTHEKVYLYKTSYINDGEDLEIADATDLNNFANIVNAGAVSVNAELTGDITLDGGTWNPIGKSSAYIGTFDGKGYTISNLTYEPNQDNCGLFGLVGAGAVIKDFTVSGEITNSSKSNIGVIGKASGTSVFITDVHSNLNITSNVAGKKIGGVLGYADTGTINIDRCTYSGTLSVEDTGNGGNYGGIVGYIWNASTAIVHISNCLFDGTVQNTSESPGGCCFGGIVGYIGANVSKYTIKNSLSIGTVSSGADNVCGMYFGIVRHKGNGFSNNYYSGDKSTWGTTSNTATELTEATSVDAGQLASGEICYALNGSINGGTNWYQTLTGDTPDLYPIPSNTSKRVYYKASTPNYINFDVSEDKIQISSASILKDFADVVNAGGTTLDAELTGNINMSDVEITVIGNSPTNAYKGTFDGNGYEINNYSLTIDGTFVASYGYGMFGNTNGATIKNFTIDGDMTFSGSGSGDFGGGLVGWPDGGTSIQNIKSSINIDAFVYSHFGGIVGSLRTATVDRCEYAGTLDGKASGNGVAGIAGYTNNGTITNCIFSGTVKGTGTGYYAGILGYVNNANANIQNCLSYGSVNNTESSWVGTLVSRLRNIGTYSNNYYKGTKGIGGVEKANDASVVANTINVIDEQLLSGEVCYKLNGNQSEINFYQTLGTDDYPTLDSSSEQVRFVGTAGYTTFYDEDNDWELLGDSKAYIGSINGSALHLDEIDDIPANTAVVIGGTYYNRVSTTATADTDGNALLGSKGTIEGDGVNIYALAKKNDVVGFYPVADGVTIPAGKAYLNLSGSLVREFFTFVFDDDDATGINSPLLTSPEEEGQVYNLAGQRISKLQKGINIINGKKVLK